MDQPNNLNTINPLERIQPNVFQEIQSSENRIPGVGFGLAKILNYKLSILLKESQYLVKKAPGEKNFTMFELIDDFFALLPKHNALIAGGSCLAAYEISKLDADIHELQSSTNEDNDDKLAEIMDKQKRIVDSVKDIDIFIPVNEILPFYKALFGDGSFEMPTRNNNDDPRITEFANVHEGILGFGNPEFHSQYARVNPSMYCESFLQKNGIKSVHRYHYFYYNVVSGELKKPFFHIDVMSIRNKRTPLEVVNAFDLTFCQIWFDGKNAYSTFPDHVRKKQGWIQKDYIPHFLNGNSFLKDRVLKYTQRGYTLLDNPELNDQIRKEIIAKTTDLVLKGSECRSVTGDIKRWKDPAFLHRWCTAFILDYIITPLGNIPQRLNNLKYSDYSQPLPQWNVFTLNKIKSKESHVFNGLQTTDGYDSEEYDTPDLKRLMSLAHAIMKKYSVNILGDEKNLNEKKTFRLSFYRITNLLLQDLYTKSTDGSSILDTLGESLTDVQGTNLYTLPQPLMEALKGYLTALRSMCLRKAPEDIGMFASEGEEVFDIHFHSPKDAISAEYMEGYLNQFIINADHTEVPCYLYNKSEPTKSCNFKLTYKDIRYIVSPEFYKKYATPPIKKLGLNQSIHSLNVTLANKPEADPTYGGMIYHYAMCPFCLQIENRDSGCTYMVHNQGSDSIPHYPFCQKDFFVQELYDKYIKAGTEYDEEEGLVGIEPHMEFCIECGRPCYRHQHFNLDTLDLIPGTNPSECTGGGRPEMFARILAVRDIYRNAGLTNAIVERQVAAEAADQAPKDKDYMAKGQVIADMPIDERIWGNANIPATKKYNNSDDWGGEEKVAEDGDNEEKVPEDGDNYNDYPNIHNNRYVNRNNNNGNSVNHLYNGGHRFQQTKKQRKTAKKLTRRKRN
jgi:hypothetical protein